MNATAETLVDQTQQNQRELDYRTARRFMGWVRELIAINMGPVKLGNVTFWIDADGPWAGEIGFDVVPSGWDINAIIADLTPRVRLHRLG